MAHMRSRSPMWREGGAADEGSVASKSKHRHSYDFPTSSSWRDERDDVEGGREGEGASDIPEEKVKKFDALLRRIEAEREKLAAQEGTPRREATPRRADRGSPANYDFASRAKELRMSLDGTPKSGTPNRQQGHFANLARNMTPRSLAGGRSESPAPSRARDTTPRSVGNAPMRSTAASRSRSPMRSSSPTPSQSEFRMQVEKFHSSLVSAHDTITVLEKDVRRLKKRVDEKDDCILSLERRNKSLDESLAKSKAEKNTLKAERSAASMKHSDEMGLLKKECEEYKKQIGEMDKQSAEHNEKVEEAEKEKQKLIGSINVKEGMITSLRSEIQRLNEELADGSFVRSQAVQAEETAKKLETELEKSREDHAAATKVIVDLEVRMKDKADEYERRLKEKDEEIANLHGGAAEKQSNDRMEAKVGRLESQLDETKTLNDELMDKVQDLEKRLGRSERAAKKKDEEIEQLESASLENESLKRQLEKEHRELERQRKRLEKYDADGAIEQETVSALEKAIEDLESSQNTDAEEIRRLKEENSSLSATLAEAEEYMKMYQQDMKEAKNLKSKLGELQDLNSDLKEQMQEKQDETSSLRMQVEASRAMAKKKILDLESEVSKKHDEISRLKGDLSLKQESQDKEEQATQKLTELMASFEENETELEELRRNKGVLLHRLSKLESELEESKTVETKSSRDQECQLEQSREEARRAWRRVGELEESLQELQDRLAEVEERDDEESPRIKELVGELDSVKGKLAERDDQLAESRTGIAEAQKMIFRLMNTVQDLRKRAKERESNHNDSSE